MIERFAQPPHELSPELINQGNCWHFARAVRMRCTPEVEIIGDGRCSPENIRHVSDCGHVWIWDPELEMHHDAECIGGVADFDRLPCFQRLKYFQRLKHRPGVIQTQKGEGKGRGENKGNRADA